MSNTIKLKRGSGSDPSASDLSVGEVALRTDNGKLFTKKDDSSVVQIGGGSGAIDDGAITNAKVASDAAIAGSKISPDFGSQNIVTTGALDVNGITIGGNTPTLNFTDANDNPDFRFLVNSNSFILEDTTNSANRFVVNSSGEVEIAGNIESTGEIRLKAPSSSTGVQVGRLEWFNENDAGVMARITVDRTATSNAPADLIFSTSANVDTTANGGDGDITERLRITSAGNVGIGADPDTILHVKANVGDMLRLDRDNSGSVGNQIAFRHKDGSGNFIETCSINAASASNAASGNLRFSTKADGGSNTERMRIKSDGTVDIGGNLDVGAGIDCTGTLNLTGNLSMTAELNFVGGSDTSRYIDAQTGTADGTHAFHIRAVTGGDSGHENMAQFFGGAGVKLFHNGGLAKFETKNYGAFINGHLLMDDNNIIKLGNSNDLQIYHDASHSIINDAGTGDLRLQVAGSTKLKLTSAGIHVQGSQEPQIVIQDSDSGNTGNAAAVSYTHLRAHET